MSSAPRVRRPAMRRRIAEAAAQLFSRGGYNETTMQAIADAAGVHVQSVYQVFGTKLAVLQEAAAVLVAGPEEEASTPPPDRAWAKELFAEPDPRRQLALYASHMRGVAERYLRLLDIMRVSATSDPDVGSFLAQAEQGRHEGPAHLMRALADKGVLKPGMTPVRAADITYALTGYETFRTLVDDRGWSSEMVESWLAETLADQLLG